VKLITNIHHVSAELKNFSRSEVKGQR